MFFRTVWNSASEPMQLPLQVPFCFKWVLKTFTLPFLHFWILFIVFLLSLSLFSSALQTEISHLQSILDAEWAQKCANNFNAKVQILVRDDDSVTVKKVRESMTHNVEKWSDTIHAKKSFTYRLYTLQSKFKGQLSTKEVDYFAICPGGRQKWCQRSETKFESHCTTCVWQTVL